jgi:hypothetical protein
MHFEILIEDFSGKTLVEELLPKIIGEQSNPHTWRIHSYKGIGHIPSHLHRLPDPSHRLLLNILPHILQAHGKYDPDGGYGTSVIVILDSDRKPCREVLDELNTVLNSCHPKPRTLFRIAIEECEAWLLGDIRAIVSAYPRAKTNILNRYVQDSICDTWEKLADAIYPGGSTVLAAKPYQEIGNIKCEWAKKIGEKLDIVSNRSPSFMKFRDGMTRLITITTPS